MQFINNTSQAVHLMLNHAAKDKIVFQINNQPFFFIQPHTKVTLSVVSTSSTSQVPDFYMFSSYLVYNNNQRSVESRFKVDSKMLTVKTPVITFTYRSVVAEKNGVMAFMIMWLIALFLVLIAPWFLVREENSKTLGVLGIIAFFVSLGFSIFMVVAYTYSRKRHYNPSSSFSKFMCRAFGKNCPLP